MGSLVGRVGEQSSVVNSYGTGICRLGSVFVFTQGSYPKIKKCVSSCETESPTLSDDFVIGQD